MPGPQSHDGSVQKLGHRHGSITSGPPTPRTNRHTHSALMVPAPTPHHHTHIDSHRDTPGFAGGLIILVSGGWSW